ncbi:MAG: ATPase [Oscillospiraceae bacterium]
MGIEKSLDKLDDLLEEAWNLPLMGNKRMIDFQRVRDVLDDIRMHLPQEVKDAKAVVSDREDIIRDARREADDIVKRAENRARQLVSQEEIFKEAQVRANAMLNESAAKSREMERAALDFAENSLKKSEDALVLGLNEIKSTRLALRSKAGRSGGKK